MQSVTSDKQMQFQSFNLLKVPVIIFLKSNKDLIFSNESFNNIYPLNEKDLYQDLKQKIINSLDYIHKNNAEHHTFDIEVNHSRKKNVFEFTAYTCDEHIIVHVQDITKLKKSQYLLNSSNTMLEKYSNDMFILANTDHLTKAANRRALFTKFNELKDTSSNFNCTISIIDIDHFKRFNDTYGHEFGDYVLEAFCINMKKTIPSTSFFARIGGEEFCLIQEKINIDKSTQNLLEILNLIKKIQLKTPSNHTVNISFSAGISEYGVDGTTLDVLLNNADKALYYAKQNGRSSVIPHSKELFTKIDYMS